MDLLKLPPVVLMKILQYVGIEDTVASVSRVCWYLHDFVSETPLIWTHFTMKRRTCAINFTNEQQISAVFKHSAYLHCFDVPGINPVYPLEQFFLSMFELKFAQKLTSDMAGSLWMPSCSFGFFTRLYQLGDIDLRRLY